MDPPASFYNAKRITPEYSHTTISLSLLNSQGLISQNRNKCQFLHGLITSLPSEHIIAITETHLTPEIGDGEITKSFEKYTVHRSDRNTEVGRKTKNGGVLLLTSPDILCTAGEKPYSNGCCELLINELGELAITIISIYRPPDATSEEFSDVLDRAKSYLTTHTSKDVIVVGDFNFPSEIVEWRELDDGVIPFPAAYRTDTRKEQFQELLNFSNEFFLQQTISKPTRESNTLDLIFTNASHMLHSPLIIPIQTSDHHLVQLQTNYGVSKNKEPRQPDDRPDIAKLNFQLADVSKMRQMLQQSDLKGLVERSPTMKEAKKSLVDKIVECAKEAGVPESKHKQHANSGKVSRDLKTLFRKRMSLLKLMRSKNAVWPPRTMPRKA